MFCSYIKSYGFLSRKGGGVVEKGGSNVKHGLAVLNPGVLEVVRNSGLIDPLGCDRMLFNARAAIERFQVVQAESTGKAKPAVSWSEKKIAIVID